MFKMDEIVSKFATNSQRLCAKCGICNGFIYYPFSARSGGALDYKLSLGLLPSHSSWAPAIVPRHFITPSEER